MKKSILTISIIAISLVAVFLATSSQACEFHRKNKQHQNAVCPKNSSIVEKRRCSSYRNISLGLGTAKYKKYPDVDYFYNADLGLYERRLIRRGRW